MFLTLALFHCNIKKTNKKMGQYLSNNDIQSNINIYTSSPPKVVPGETSQIGNNLHLLGIVQRSYNVFYP